MKMPKLEHGRETVQSDTWDCWMAGLDTIFIINSKAVQENIVFHVFKL